LEAQRAGLQECTIKWSRFVVLMVYGCEIVNAISSLKSQVSESERRRTKDVYCE
jgi:hypothetical protein